MVFNLKIVVIYFILFAALKWHRNCLLFFNYAWRILSLFAENKYMKQSCNFSLEKLNVIYTVLTLHFPSFLILFENHIEVWGWGARLKEKRAINILPYYCYRTHNFNVIDAKLLNLHKSKISIENKYFAVQLFFQTIYLQKKGKSVTNGNKRLLYIAKCVVCFLFQLK